MPTDVAAIRAAHRTDRRELHPRLRNDGVAPCATAPASLRAPVLSVNDGKARPFAGGLQTEAGPEDRQQRGHDCAIHPAQREAQGASVNCSELTWIVLDSAGSGCSDIPGLRACGAIGGLTEDLRDECAQLEAPRFGLSLQGSFHLRLDLAADGAPPRFAGRCACSGHVGTLPGRSPLCIRRVSSVRASPRSQTVDRSSGNGVTLAATADPVQPLRQRSRLPRVSRSRPGQRNQGQPG